MSRKRVACPSCRSQNRDGSGNNLSLFPDDETKGWCPVCNKVVQANGEQVAYTPRSNATTKDTGLELAAIKRLPIKALTHKPITQETCEKFGVRCAVSEETGEIDRVYYPYTDQDGNVVGYKVRTLPKEFMAIGRVKGLFGQSVAKKGAKLLIITEGEDDCVSAWQMLQTLGKDYNCVSIPNGANVEGTIDAATRAELEFITSHKSVFICLDNDKPGQATALALAELLAGQCRVKVLKLPRKDAGQMLMEDMAKEFEKEFYTPDFSPQKIVRGQDISLKALRTAKPKGFPLPYPKLNAKLQGLRRGEITLITGGSGLGKTQLVRELGFDLVTKHNLTVANIMLETPYEDVARAYIAMDNGIPPYKLIFNPNAISEEAYEKSRVKLLESNRLHFFAHWGSLDAEVLVSKCSYFVKALGVDFIILDHISLAVAGQDTDERKTLDMAFEALTRLCVETGVGVIVVMHLKRVQGKNWAAGDEVDLTDLRGTAGAEQMSWTVISVERNTKDEATRDISKITVLKNRTVGFLGQCDSLLYSHDTGRLALIEAGY